MTGFFAHSENAAGRRHDLVEHLRAVAGRAQAFASKFSAAEFGYWAGLWHDLGKFHPGFQDYIASPQGRRGPDHSSAGAAHALASLEPLAFLVAGHHAGLPSASDLRTRLKEKATSEQVIAALGLAEKAVGPLKPQGPLQGKLPAFLGRGSHGSSAGDLRRATELFLRMVFGALVDADFLDTEAHFDSARPARRGRGPSLDLLWSRLECHQRGLSGKRSDTVNVARHEIYQACVTAADAPDKLV